LFDALASDQAAGVSDEDLEAQGISSSMLDCEFRRNPAGDSVIPAGVPI